MNKEYDDESDEDNIIQDLENKMVLGLTTDIKKPMDDDTINTA